MNAGERPDAATAVPPRGPDVTPPAPILKRRGVGDDSPSHGAPTRRDPLPPMPAPSPAPDTVPAAPAPARRHALAQLLQGYDRALDALADGRDGDASRQLDILREAHAGGSTAGAQFAALLGWCAEALARGDRGAAVRTLTSLRRAWAEAGRPQAGATGV